MSQNKYENMDCKIYVHIEMDIKNLVKIVSPVVNGKIESNTIQIPFGEMDVIKNQDFDKIKCKDFPDGFLYFRYSIEFYFFSEEELQNSIMLVSKLLEHLWSNNIPAVAACDYENELPNKGGYKSINIPWVA